MPLWELSKDRLAPLDRTSFEQSAIWERRDLQRLLRDQVDVLGDDLMVIAEEFSNWIHSDLRIDLLCIDRDANLVVIELKRDDRGGHSDLQAIRYASMVAPATFEQIVEAYRAYTVRRHRDSTAYTELEKDEARQAIREFLGWAEPDEERFGDDVRIILASTDFSIPLTSAVLWLRTRGNIDIRCIRLVPYAFESVGERRILVDVQQLVPLPEAADLTDRMADKEDRKREARAAAGTRDTRRFDLTLAGRSYQRLPKRRLAYEVVRAALMDFGVSPEQILDQTREGRRRGRRMLIKLGEQLSEDQALEAFMETGREARRFYLDNADLFQVHSATWVFTNQWGEQTEEFVSEVARLAPNMNITVDPADEERRSEGPS